MLSLAEVAAGLILREWIQLCDAADRALGKVEEHLSRLHGTDGNVAVAEKHKTVKFDVVAVERRGRSWKRAVFQVDGKNYGMEWTNLAVMPRPEASGAVLYENGQAAG